MNYVQPEIWETIIKDYKYQHMDKIQERLNSVVSSYLCEIICNQLNHHTSKNIISIPMSQYGDDINLKLILLIPILKNILNNTIDRYIELIGTNISASITFTINTDKQILTFMVKYV